MSPKHCGCASNIDSHGQEFDASSQSSKDTYDSVHGANKYIPEIPRSKRRCFVIVDPWSTGNRLCREIVKEGFDLVIVWPTIVRSTSLPASHVVTNDDPNNIISELKNLRNTTYDIVSILSGSETGVVVAEKLAFSLGVLCNSPQLSLARRNKYLMGEALKAKGVRSVYQLITTDLSVAEEFINNWKPNPFKVILKPNMGAGSDDVFLCKSMEEVKKNFEIINGKINSLGLKNDGVLVQEYLEGIEYVVDTITYKGVHRIVSMWQYDKREVNGRFNIYHGNIPLVANTPEAIVLQKYILQVLDALEFTNGPGHAEIKITPTGPCLVEIGARCHGGNATWMDVAQQSWGFNQLTLLVHAFGHGTHSNTYLEDGVEVVFPTKYKRFGVCLDMIGYEKGEIISINGDSYVRSLKSFYVVEYYRKVGDQMWVTVDCNTSPGQVILIHDDKQVVMKEYNDIHKLLKEKNSFFQLKNSEVKV